MYGCETWTLRKVVQNQILIFQRKILKRIFELFLDETMGE
jgi:hypothetical protein